MTVSGVRGVDGGGDVDAHGIIYAETKPHSVEIVCRCGEHKVVWAATLPSYGAVLAQHMAEAKERQIDYEAGLWCGECRYHVVEEPPCCWPPSAPVSSSSGSETDEGWPMPTDGCTGALCDCTPDERREDVPRAAKEARCMCGRLIEEHLPLGQCPQPRSCECGHALSSHGPALGCPVCDCVRPPRIASRHGWLPHVYPDHPFDQPEAARAADVTKETRERDKPQVREMVARRLAQAEGKPFELMSDFVQGIWLQEADDFLAVLAAVGVPADQERNEQ